MVVQFTAAPEVNDGSDPPPVSSDIENVRAETHCVVYFILVADRHRLLYYHFFPLTSVVKVKVKLSFDKFYLRYKATFTECNHKYTGQIWGD